jgi:voltage-gated sodium channel
VLIGTFVMLNLFIAIVINNLEASKVAELEELRQPATQDELLHEITRTRDALAGLRQKLEGLAISETARRRS